MRIGKGKSSAAVVVAAALALTAAAAAQAQLPPPDPHAPGPVPCTSIGDGKHQCTFWPAGDGIHGGAVVVNGRGYWVGYLNQGANWVSCQMWGGKVRRGNFHNHWWAWTEANDHRWGWVNAVWASGGANDGKFAGVPKCDPVHSAAPPGQRSSGPAKRAPKPRKHVPKPNRSRPAAVPCRSIGGAKHQCTFWPGGNGHSGGAPVRDASGHVVGYLHKGSNWIVCQQQGRRATYGRYYNNDWGWTLADDGKWGWVNAVWASGGDNDGAFGGTPACYGVHGNPPGVSYPVRPPANPKPKPKPKPPACPRYEILGLRGAGEGYAGLYNMGDIVGVAGYTTMYAIEHLPAHSAVAYSIPYAATSIDTLIKDPNTWFRSMVYGEYILEAAVHKLVVRCPHTRIAIIGYSMGAAVASEAVRKTMGSADLARIKALVLFADPYSAGNTKYANTYSLTESQRGLKRDGHGIFGGKRIPLPASKIADVCFNVDPVCVSGGVTTLVNALFSGVHQDYTSWDGNGLAPNFLPLIYGLFVAHKLEGK